MVKRQAKAIDERWWVTHCMEALCQKAGFSDPRQMVQRDLSFLCDEIDAKTGVLISLSTIKRLINGQFSRLPQVATLNALAATLGYPNWQAFKADTAPTPTPRRRVSLKSLVLPGVAVLLILTAVAGLSLRKHPLRNIEKAQFSAVKTTRNDIPNTVIFKYDVDDVGADSFFIQQSWDRHRRVRIYKHQYTLTDVYYEPGYHMAKLIANDQIIKTFDVSIPTDKWVFYAKKNLSAIPQYINAAGAKDGALQMLKGEVVDSHVDIGLDNEYIQAYFPSRISAGSDNFVLTCRVRVNLLKNEACPDLMCEVYCQRYFMYFIGASVGCAGEMNAQFGENALSGRTNDLRGLGADFRNWTNIEWIVKDRKVHIRMNGKEVFTTAYQKTCGLITGLGFASNGLCQVDSVSLRTLDGLDVYHNDF
jgi:hypothetical protein